MVAIDTNVAIAHLNNKLRLPPGVSTEQLALPVTVVGELLFGAYNSGRVAANLLAYRSFIYDLNVLVVDALAAEYYAEIRFALKKLGQPIPENDIWIAAICRATDAPLFTFDKHFDRVAGLQLIGN